MVDLRERVAELIDAEKEVQYYALLECDWTDQISYNDRNIVRDFEEYSGLSLRDIEDEFIQFLCDNQSQILTVVDAGLPYLSPNHYSLASVGEIYFEMPDWLAKIKPDLINRNTDLYVDGTDYAYVTADYDYVAIDYNEIDYEEFIKSLEE